MHQDAAFAVAHFFDGGLGADTDGAAAGGVGVADAAGAHDDAAGGEIRAFDVVHQFFIGDVAVTDHGDDAVNDFAQVVGRDIGGHTNGDTRGTVD